VELLGFHLPDRAAHMVILQALAQRLGEWALLLKLVNGALREQVEAGSPLAEAFAFVNEGLDEEGISAFNLEHQAGRHAAVDRTIALSLRLLSSEEQARYAELAVFPEDTDVPLATVTRYWQATGALSGFKAKNLCSKLARLSLLLRYNLAAKTIRLHDVVRSYLQHTHAANLTTWHAALLDAHRPADGWPALPADEPYLWQHLAYHLLAAGKEEVLFSLAKNGAFWFDTSSLPNERVDAISSGKLDYARRNFVHHIVAAGQIDQLKQIVHYLRLHHRNEQ
jgi:hypothetical protein